MLVLDYLRPLLQCNGDQRAITIPPFHAGHLGFVPDSEVHIGLLAPFTQDGTHCEILVTPYEAGMQLGRLTCTMLDRRGVVKQLVDAVSSLDVNIMLVETSSIHYARYHQVNLLFNWGTSAFDPTEKSSLSDQQRYHVYRTNFPIDLRCYVLLFEKIVRFCLEDLGLENIAGLQLPSLYIRPVATPNNVDVKNRIKITRAIDVVSEPVAGHKLVGHVAVKLGKELEHSLRQRLAVDQHRPLEYLLISETEDRLLRVFFPKPESVEQMVHVGIRHEDVPGAMSYLLRLIRIAGFNVLTGLLRQGDGISRMWEGLLQYDGHRAFDKSTIRTNYTWVADRLAFAAYAIDPKGLRLDRYDLQIGPPRYPKAGGHNIHLRTAFRALKSRIPSMGAPDHNELRYVETQKRDFKTEILLKQEPASTDEDEQKDKRKNSLYTVNRPSADRPHLLKLYDLVVAGQSARTRPRIFLSYPFSAKSKADQVATSLEKHFEFERYEEGDNKIIVDEVVRRIESCDYFIGIWDPDRPDASGRRPVTPKSGWRVSAWLPFEYGIAKTARKPTVLAHHNQLDKKVWNRISPEVAQPGYDDLEGTSFEKVALPFIYRHCVQEWIPSQSDPGSIAKKAAAKQGPRARKPRSNQ